MGMCSTTPILLPLLSLSSSSLLLLLLLWEGLYPAVSIQIQEQLCELVLSVHYGSWKLTQIIRLACQGIFYWAILLALITHKSLLQSLCFSVFPGSLLQILCLQDRYGIQKCECGKTGSLAVSWSSNLLWSQVLPWTLDPAPWVVFTWVGHLVWPEFFWFLFVSSWKFHCVTLAL